MGQKLQRSFQDDLVEPFTEIDLYTAYLRFLAQALQAAY